MSKATLASVFALALAAVPAAGCEPEVPANPTYEVNVKAIFQARCVRCHDETFRGDPVPSNPSVDDLPLRCHLNRYESTGDCSDAGQTMIGVCSFGAGLCGNSTVLSSLIRSQLWPPSGGPPLMPPAPASPPSDWEMAVLGKWTTNLGSDGLPLP